MTGPERRLRRAREMTSIYAVMAGIVLLLLVQFLLLMVGLEGFAGGRWSVLLPAALGSGACFGGACWLIRYLPVGSRRKAG